MHLFPLPSPVEQLTTFPHLDLPYIVRPTADHDRGLRSNSNLALALRPWSPSQHITYHKASEEERGPGQRRRGQFLSRPPNPQVETLMAMNVDMFLCLQR